MNNNLLRIKVQQRLNKLASNDYDNIECWQIVEAVNKAQEEWFRRQVHGINIKKEGSEQSIATIDDLQKFVKVVPLKGTNKDRYFRTESLPSDYAHFIRVEALANNEVCKNRRMTVYLGEEANVDVLISDAFKKPDFDWAETFGTLSEDGINIYHDGLFDVTSANLSYYRKPRQIAFDGCVDPATGNTTSDIESEMRDDVMELIVDEAVAILTGDIESWNQFSREIQNAQRSN